MEQSGPTPADNMAPHIITEETSSCLDSVLLNTSSRLWDLDFKINIFILWSSGFAHILPDSQHNTDTDMQVYKNPPIFPNLLSPKMSAVKQAHSSRGVATILHHP